MSFLQPWMLWGLAAATLPVLIHLLNRLRYRTVRWGAMMFLLRVSRSAIRHSRLRHYLILACRTLAVAALAMAMARPLLGGWLGAGLAGAPDAIVILLDRSASMERVDPRRQTSRREQAIRLVSLLPPELSRGSRVILIDSALREPREIASVSALPSLALAGPTDTAADWPALFQTALDWMKRDRPGRTEVWALTDLQQSNWQPESGEWANIAARVAAQSHPAKVRVLAVNGEGPDGNRALRLKEIRGWTQGDKTSLVISLGLSVPEPESAPVPAALTVNEVRSVLPLPARAFVNEGWHEIPASSVTSGWGRVDLPADQNAGDNSAFFAYSAPVDGITLASTPQESLALRIRYAVEDGTAERPKFVRIPHSDTTVLPELSNGGLLVWQGAPPEPPLAERMEDFIRGGGVVLFLPPEKRPDSAGGAWAGFAWGDPVSAPAGSGFPVGRWEEMEGPLARTSDGTSLPLSERVIHRRCTPTLADPGAWFTVAQFSDGQPLMTRRSMGTGRLYVLALLPETSWSDMEDGRVWVPIIRRLRDEGSRRLGQARNARCGEWRPESGGEPWVALSAPEGRDPRIHAGAYRQGDRLLALNRPDEEDDPETLDAESLRKILPGVNVSQIGDTRSQDRLQTEAAFLLLALAALFVLAEAFLSLADFPTAVAAADRGAGRNP